jgi:tripartite-type tricarboxylate transporter receptor subunit TctC
MSTKPWLFLLFAAPFLASGVHAQQYPTRPIRIIVALTPGTGPDLIARRVGEKFQERLGQPAIVENKPGLSGHLGAEAVARSTPDGYTLLVTTSTLPMTATLYAAAYPGFNAMKDLAPLTSTSSGQTTLVASTKSGFTSMADVIAKAKANPGKVSFATPGVGHPFHFSMEFLQEETGVKFLHVPYKGTGPALTDLIGGVVDVMFSSTHTIAPYVAKGQVRGIASLTRERHRLLPDVPSYGELGLKLRSSGWFGFLAPIAVPPPILNRLSNEIRAILVMPEVKAPLEKVGMEIEPSTPEAMRADMQAEFAEMAVAIKKYNIQP